MRIRTAADPRLPSAFGTRPLDADGRGRPRPTQLSQLLGGRAELPGSSGESSRAPELDTYPERTANGDVPWEVRPSRDGEQAGPAPWPWHARARTHTRRRPAPRTRPRLHGNVHRFLHWESHLPEAKPRPSRAPTPATGRQTRWAVPGCMGSRGRDLLLPAATGQEVLRGRACFQATTCMDTSRRALRHRDPPGVLSVFFNLCFFNNF